MAEPVVDYYALKRRAEECERNGNVHELMAIVAKLNSRPRVTYNQDPLHRQVRYECVMAAGNFPAYFGIRNEADRLEYARRSRKLEHDIAVEYERRKAELRAADAEAVLWYRRGVGLAQSRLVGACLAARQSQPYSLVGTDLVEPVEHFESRVQAVREAHAAVMAGVVGPSPSAAGGAVTVMESVPLFAEPASGLARRLFQRLLISPGLWLGDDGLMAAAMGSSSPVGPVLADICRGLGSVPTADEWRIAWSLVARLAERVTAGCRGGAVGHPDTGDGLLRHAGGLFDRGGLVRAGWPDYPAELYAALVLGFCRVVYRCYRQGEHDPG